MKKKVISVLLCAAMTAGLSADNSRHCGGCEGSSGRRYGCEADWSWTSFRNV